MCCPCWIPSARLLPAFSHRYVYDHIGGEHSEVIPELAASVATFAVTTLWLGPCDIVYLWSLLNCFGLNFELWVQKLAEREPLAHIEVSREGLAGDCCSLKAPSHTWSPVQNFLTTTLLVVRTMAHLGGIWPSLPSVWCGTPRAGYVGQTLIFNNGRELAWDSQTRAYPRASVTMTSSLWASCHTDNAFLHRAGLSVGADVSQGPGYLWGHELLGYHHVQPCKPEQPGVHRAGRPAPATLR